MNLRHPGYHPRQPKPTAEDWQRAARQLDALAGQAADPIIARGLHQAARDARERAQKMRAVA